MAKTPDLPSMEEAIAQVYKETTGNDLSENGARVTACPRLGCPNSTSVYCGNCGQGYCSDHIPQQVDEIPGLRFPVCDVCQGSVNIWTGDRPEEIPDLTLKSAALGREEDPEEKIWVRPPQAPPLYTPPVVEEPATILRPDNAPLLPQDAAVLTANTPEVEEPEIVRPSQAPTPVEMPATPPVPPSDAEALLIDNRDIDLTKFEES